MKPKIIRKVEIEEFPLTDDSNNEEDDDIEKDPDWKRTPLYNRVQSLIVIYRLSIFFSIFFQLFNCN